MQTINKMGLSCHPLNQDWVMGKPYRLILPVDHRCICTRITKSPHGFEMIISIQYCGSFLKSFDLIRNLKLRRIKKIFSGRWDSTVSQILILLYLLSPHVRLIKSHITLIQIDRSNHYLQCESCLSERWF